MKRIATRTLVRVHRKAAVFLKKPEAGKHAHDNAITIRMLLRDVLHFAQNAKEADVALRDGQVLVDGKIVHDPGTAIGIMDIVTIPTMNHEYRMLNTHAGLLPIKVTKEEAKVKLCKIRNKHAQGPRVQLNLHDGRNVLIEKEEDRFKTGDTVILKLPEQKIEGFIKLEKGAKCYVAQGKHAGETGVLEEVLAHKPGTPADAKLKGTRGEVITHKDYLFAVDKNFKTQ